MQINSWLKIFLMTGFILLLLYGIACLLLYNNQESILFLPEKLEQLHAFDFQSEFEEISLKTHDGLKLHALHFKTEHPKGVIYFLHGNGGSLDRWGNAGEVYSQMNYDVFIPDYRGYGKSEGSYDNLNDLFADVQTGYDHLKGIYPEDKILVFGYSIGTGLAAKIAAENKPAKLVLHAPYFSMEDMMKCRFPFISSSLLKYSIRTSEYFEKSEAPVYIFHGTDDRVIPVSQTKKILNSSKKEIQFYEISGQGHNGMIVNQVYQNLIEKIL